MGDSWGDRAFSIVFHRKKKKPLRPARVRVRESDFIEERESNGKRMESLSSGAIVVEVLFFFSVTGASL